MRKFLGRIKYLTLISILTSCFIGVFAVEAPKTPMLTPCAVGNSPAYTRNLNIKNKDFKKLYLDIQINVEHKTE